MRCIHSYGPSIISRTHPAFAAAAVTPCAFQDFLHQSLTRGLSVFHARLAQLSTRDLACLS